MAPELHLGTRDISAILEPGYAPKVGHPQPEGNRVAIIVNHGMGQQVPYETIDGVAQAVWRGVALPQSGATSPRSLIRRVRLGTQGKDAETELVRAEIQIQHEQRTFDVHIYESYWAPLTEGKVALSDVMTFLFDAGWNGFMNTEAKKGYQRWMFGEERSFELPKVWLVLILGALILLLLALVFMNAVLAAAAASHAVGAGGSFPGDFIQPLTADFIAADVGAVLIALATWLLPWLYKKLTHSATIPLWLSWLGRWILIPVGAVLIVLAGFFMPLRLAGLSPENVWPLVNRWADWLVATSSKPTHVELAFRKALLAGLWGFELLAAYAGRWFLVEYVGDVTAYIAAHTVSKFYDLRQQIWKTAMQVARAIYRAEAHHKPNPEATDFLYHKVIVVGHSLGSVIGYDVLNGLLLEEATSDHPLHVVDRTRVFLTFGSPLDKTAFLFRTQADMRSAVREVAAAAVQPMIQSYDNRPLEWINLYSKSDIISGALDFYDPPNRGNAKNKALFLNPATAPAVHPRAVQNLVDPQARTPLAAHVEYWNGDLFAKQLVRAITT